MTTSSEYQAAVDKVVVNAERLNQFVNGDADTVVNTDNGPIPVLAELIEQLEDRVETGLAGSTVSSIVGLQAALDTRVPTLDLASALSNKGAGLSGFSHAASYAAGSAGAKLKAFVSVKDAPFNAKGDGTTNDTAAIQAAIDQVGTSGGGDVIFPSGVYRITAQLNVTANGVRLRGTSRFATVIRQDTMSAKAVVFSGIFNGFDGLSVIYGGTPAVGGTAIYITGSYCTLNDFVVRSSNIGVHFYGSNAVAGKVTNFELLDYEQAGIICESLNDVFVANFIINAGDTTRGTLGGIRLVDKAEAVIVSNGDILLGVYSMTTDAAVNGQNTRPAYNKFTNVYFDSSVSGVLLTKTVETEFVNCWFSGGRSGSGNPGCTIDVADSISFSHTNFFNNGSHGALVTANAKRTIFDGCKFESNSVTAGAGVAHGVTFAAGSTDFIVKGCIAHNGLYTGTQGYGIFVNAGASDRYIIADNLVTGNATGGVSDGGTGVNKRVGNNY